MIHNKTVDKNLDIYSNDTKTEKVAQFKYLG